LRDLKDDHLLEVAAVSNSRHIVTFNVNDFRGVEKFGVKAVPSPPRIFEIDRYCEMSTLSLRLPDSLYGQVKVLARQDRISINQFISSAVAEKMSALMMEEYLGTRAKAGNEEGFYKALPKVPSAGPSEQDAL